ncbi:DUF4350 domain-containing protein [Pedobacter sp. Leaf176]|uniref:DUF4350 domain-containing protein n=1 Tax=Pedobacter sp. Leaf176 TaxID=1736286 RepID=UPI000701AD5B|nr:DUF4350 domain-containing protein [Pedobacter sp. Leaf176]KQR69638.1 hypothetical protein ASF92_13055 [Pedobacter sp. Leaf176]
MKGYKVYYAIGLVLILLYLVAQFNKPSPTDWSPTYAKKDKIPYGTFIFYNRIKDILPRADIKTSATSIYNTFKNKGYQNSTYIIIAPQIKIEKADIEQLKKYITAGNDVFIASYDLGAIAEKDLKLKRSVSFSPNGSSVNFTNPNLKTVVNYGFEKGIGNQYFSKIDTAKATVLGIDANNHVNFVKYSFGKGALYLMAGPGFYSNFNLLDKYGAEYAAKTLSYLQGTKTLIYDEYFTTPKTGQTDLLRVLFKHPELKYAYYLCIFSLLLFVFYDIKRRQRVIPIADPYTNTSVEFAHVVGSVYYSERNNLDIAKKKINYLMEHLRSRYYLKTNDIQRDFAETLQLKTGINETLAKTLTRYFLQIPTFTEFSDAELIGLNNIIEQFYKNTKPNGAGTTTI